jgi:hypothetical protein
MSWKKKSNKPFVIERMWSVIVKSLDSCPGIIWAPRPEIRELHHLGLHKFRLVLEVAAHAVVSKSKSPVQVLLKDFQGACSKHCTIVTHFLFVEHLALWLISFMFHYYLVCFNLCARIWIVFLFWAVAFWNVCQVLVLTQPLFPAHTNVYLIHGIVTQEVAWKYGSRGLRF